MIPYGRQYVSDEDVNAVVKVLRSDFLTQGPMVPEFENAVASKVGAGHAVAVNSATSGLHIACMAFGIGPGDVLWTVPTTFVASANCARYCGADVDFVDIDAETWNISVPALRAKLAAAKDSGRLPKVVVPVHLGGQPTEQEAIRELSREYGFYVLEDASHSIGASREGEPVGSCRWSDITVFSFHPVKIITTAEGGMALTNDPALAHAMALARSHGITRDRALLRRPPQGEWVYEQQTLGYNYRLSEIHAALGMSQLPRVDSIVERRNEIARQYGQALRGLPLKAQEIAPGNISSYHLYLIRLDGEKRADHARIFAELRKRGIGVNLHYTPVHLQPYYRGLGFSEHHCPEAERYASDSITIPLFPTMSNEDVDAVTTALHEVLC